MSYNKFQYGGSMNVLTKSEQDDHVYIDINIKYNPGRDVGQNSSLANYSTTKTEPLIMNPSLYHLVIDRFALSGFLIPTYIFVPTEPGRVTLRYLGVDYSADLIFTPRSNTTPLTDDSYYYIYEYQHYLDMLNQAFIDAFALIPVPPVGASAPYMVWDSVAQRFSLYAIELFYKDTVANPIDIFINDTLYRIFPFFPYFEETNVFWQFIVSDQRNNREVIGIVNYLFLKQEASGVGYWNPAKGLVFTSNSIPVKNTYTQINNQLSNQQDSNASSLGILIDFKLDVVNSLDQRKQLLYTPQQNYRRLDLYGASPLRTIDIQIYWVDLFGVLHPLRIPKDQEANIKLLFIRKSYIED